MLTVIDWLMANYKWILIVMTLLVVLSIVGSLTTTIRGAKKGLKEIFTPLGFVIFIIIAVILLLLVISLTKSIK